MSYQAPATTMSELSFTDTLSSKMQKWVNLPIPQDPVALHAHADSAITLFSQVTPQYNAVVSHQASFISDHYTAMAKASDAPNALEGDLDAPDESLVENRATSEALAAHPLGGGGGGCPVPIPELAGFSGTKEVLNILLYRMANKLKGVAAQFTSQIHQISYAVSCLTSNAFEQI